MKKKKTKCRAQQQYIQLKSNERKKKIKSNKTMEKNELLLGDLRECDKFTLEIRHRKML